MAKKVTLESLATMIGGVEKSLKNEIKTNASLIELTWQETAKSEDLKKVKATTDSIYKMLDDEARFIQQMRAEYPLLIKRLERIEKKLGLPHRIF